MKLSKIIAFALALLMIGMLIAVGCAPKPAPTPTPTPAPKPSPSPTPAPSPSPTPAQPPKVIKWQGQPISPPGTLETDNMQDIADRIKAASGGRLEIVLNASGSVVPASKEWDGVDNGALDYGNTAPSYLVDKWPAANPLAYMVGGLTGMEYALWMWVGGGNEIVQKMYGSRNIHTLTNALVTPPEVFLQSKKELKSLADIKGLKIRTTGDDGEIFTTMGASVIFLPGTEIYQSIQRGVIDAAQLSTPAVDWTFAIHEVAKYEYLSAVRQPTDPTWVFASPKAWAALPDDLKKIVEEIHYSQGYRWYARLTQEDLVALQKQRDYGVVVQPIPKDIEDEMIRLAKELYAKKSAADPLYAEVVKSEQAFQAKYRAAWARL